MSAETLANLKQLILWSYENPRYECGLRLSSMLNYTKAEGADDIASYRLFGIKGWKQTGSHKDFDAIIKYSNKEEFNKDIKRGDWVAYDKAGQDPHFAWYLGENRRGEPVYFESVGHLSDARKGNTSYYLPKSIRFKDKPFYSGPRDTERIETAASILDNGKEIKVSNAVASTFGTKGATYFRLPSKYDMTEDEWLELIDYIVELRSYYKPKDDHLYLYKNSTDLDIFNLIHDTQGPIKGKMHESINNTTYHYANQFDPAMRRIAINIEHKSGGM